MKTNQLFSNKEIIGTNFKTYYNNKYECKICKLKYPKKEMRGTICYICTKEIKEKLKLIKEIKKINNRIKERKNYEST